MFLFPFPRIFIHEIFSSCAVLLPSAFTHAFLSHLFVLSYTPLLFLLTLFTLAFPSCFYSPIILILSSLHRYLFVYFEPHSPLRHLFPSFTHVFHRYNTVFFFSPALIVHVFLFSCPLSHAWDYSSVSHLYVFPFMTRFP